MKIGNIIEQSLVSKNIDIFPFIKNCALTNSPDLSVNIAKFHASLDGYDLSTRIGEYGIKKPNHLREIAKIAVENYQDKKRKNFLLNLNNYGIEEAEFLFQLTTTGYIHDSEAEFQNDIQGLLKKESKQGEKYIVSTDDPYDLLLCGTEVAGSCQRINGDPKYNKCLLAYLMDGKNRLLAVKDSQGKIFARSILRLMYNRNSQKPVLFLERIYPSGSKFQQPLINMALSEGARLGLEVTSREEGKKEDIYYDDIESLGSKAPRNMWMLSVESQMEPSLFQVHTY